MSDLDLVKLLGQGGITITALGVLAVLLWRIGNRMIAAIDRVGLKVEEHTKTDIAAHGGLGVQFGVLREEVQRTGADMQRDLAVLASRVDAALDWSERTPVGAEPRTHPRRQSAMMRAVDDRSDTEYSFTPPPRRR